MRSKNQEKTEASAFELLKKIRRMKGNKVLTINCDEGFCSIGINEKGFVGRTKRDLEGAIENIELLMEIGGAMVVRQYTGLHIVEGKKKIPVCKLCGIRVEDGNFVFMPKETMEWAHCHDAATGEPIPKEPGVQFSVFEDMRG